MTTLKRKLNLALTAKKKKMNLKIEESHSLQLCLTSLPLPREYFSTSCCELANFLLGKLIVRQLNNILLKGRIVETECYLGGEDKASHSYNGRRTPSNEPMFMEPGTSYVYKIYGVYHCFNISSREAGAAVLIRALEPVDGIEKMQEFRNASRSKEIKVHELCRGPSKLCISLNITKENCNKLDLCIGRDLWIEADDFPNNFQIVDTTRVGIGSAGEEWANKRLRFYIKGNLHVSKRDRQKEKASDTNFM